MLVKIAFVLLGAWLVGVVGPFETGTPVHLLLLVGLMLLLLGGVKARDAARTVGPHTNDAPRPR